MPERLSRPAVALIFAALGLALVVLPVAGLFAEGEIGPVGSASFLHAFTATVAVFPAR